MSFFQILQIAEPVRCRRASVDEDVAAGDETAFVAHEKFRQVTDFIRRAGAAGRAEGQHLAVAIFARAVELVLSQGRNDDARTDGIDGRASFSPVRGFGHDPQDVAALRILIGLQRICDGFEKGQVQQFFRRRQSQSIRFFLR